MKLLSLLVFISTWLQLLKGAKPCGCIIALTTDGSFYGIDVPTGYTQKVVSLGISVNNLAQDTSVSPPIYYVLDPKGYLYKIDLCKPSAKNLGSTDVSNVYATAVDPNSNLLAFSAPSSSPSKRSLYAIDVNGGKVASIGSTANDIVSALYNLNLEGTLYASGSSLYIIKETTGEVGSKAYTVPTMNGIDYYRCKTTNSSVLLGMIADDDAVYKIDFNTQKYGTFFKADKQLKITGITTFNGPCCTMCSWDFPCYPYTNSPTKSPTTTKPPSKSPTTKKPTANPTKKPTSNPTKRPTSNPTKRPTLNPTKMPTTKIPTKQPNNNPSHAPLPAPTKNPTKRPSLSPTPPPILYPTPLITTTQASSTSNPTRKPTSAPTPAQDAGRFGNNSGHSGGMSANTYAFAGVGGVAVCICVFLLGVWRGRKNKKKNDTNQLHKQIAMSESGHKLGRSLQSSSIIETNEGESTQPNTSNLVRKPRDTHNISPAIDASVFVIAAEVTPEGKKRSSPPPRLPAMPKASLITPGLSTKDVRHDEDSEDEDSMYHKASTNETPQTDPLRAFLDKIQLGNYHRTIVNSGWNLELLTNAYSDTPEATTELKSIFRNDWKMTLQESLRLLTAIKTEKIAQSNIEGAETTENALAEGAYH